MRGREIVEQLAAEGAVQSVHARAALAAQSPLDHLADQMGEDPLLSQLAERAGVRFVSAARLMNLQVQPEALALMRPAQAERLGIVPVRFVQGMLSCLACELDIAALSQELRASFPIQRVTIFLALPRSIDAMIARHYHGDRHAIARLMTRKRLHTPPDFGGAQAELTIQDEALSRSLASLGASSPPGPTIQKIEAPHAASQTASSAASTAPSTAPTATSLLAPMQELVRVFVSLQDARREGLSGHSLAVAELVGQIGVRLNLPEEMLQAFKLAGLLHDVGKHGIYHLTPLNVARYDGHRLQAERSYSTVVRLFEHALLPDATILALENLYERFDGAGFPQRLRERDIPLGARILAVSETYHDLIANERNPYRRKLSPAEATSVITELGSKLFDPAITDALRRCVAVAVRAPQHRVLLVEPDIDEAAALDMRLSAAGYETSLARGAAQAKPLLGGVHALITELDLERVGAGFELLAQAKAQGVPAIVLSSRGDRESIARATERGCADFVIKPVSAEIVVSKLAPLVERGVAGAAALSGSLAEMPLAALLQVLSSGRKSGLLTIRSGQARAEIHFVEGAIWDAHFGHLRGEPAIYALLKIEEGQFTLRPFAPETKAGPGAASEAERPLTRRIQQSTEALLLEGMRLIDEEL